MRRSPRRSVWRMRAIPLAGAAAVLAMFAGCAGGVTAPTIANTAAAPRTVWLDQGWDEAARSWFHHAPQGTDTLPLPYDWFMALEVPVAGAGRKGRFADPANLDRYGFIPGVTNADNPDDLPVGFVRIQADNPGTGLRFDHLGFTCAACHTGRMSYRGTQIFVDGGAAMIDVTGFRKALAKALLLTKIDPPRFLRFADRVLGPGHPVADGVRLKLRLDQLVIGGLGMELAHLGDKRSLEEGFGRVDALNRIGNEVFSDQMKIRSNYAPLTAPVAFPHIWDLPWFDWVQYNSSIEQPMVRNAGESMGVRALVDYTGGRAGRFTSTVPVDGLYRIEQLLAGPSQPKAGDRFTGLRSPRWPESILPAIDHARARQGEALYLQRCAGCHLPAPGSAAFWSSDAWLPANADGMRYLRPPLIPVSEIGTDPAQAVDMKNRRVSVPLDFGLTGAVSVDGAMGSYAYGPALGQVVAKVVDRWYDTRTPVVSPADRRRMNGFRDNGIRGGVPGPNGSIPVYKARPLNGVWATAPFLHNGSVPTLYALLSPYSERPREFWLGNREFDPVKVGYVTTPIAGGFRLIAVDRASGKAVRGNSNAGHVFETPADPARPRPGTIGPTLSRDERMALIEYLKTL